MSYIAYYNNQAGSGIQGYHAFRNQRGRGIFGSLWRNIAWPFLKYAGKKALNMGLDIGKDTAYGMDIKSSLKNRAREHGADIVDDLAEQAKKVLRGQGKRKRKRRATKKRATKKTKPAMKQKNSQKLKKRKRKYKRANKMSLFSK